MRAFTSPAKWLAGISPDAAALLIQAAADMALIFDRQGIVRDFAFTADEFGLAFTGTELWLGRLWRDQVTIESRPKIDDMVKAGQGKAPPAGRQVNYPAAKGNDIPVLMSVQPIGQTGLTIAFGRDLRAFAALQQRVVEVQQSFERDYARMRHIETRYRLLFQMTPEPVLIVDIASLKITDANPAARQTAGAKAKLIGMTIAEFFAPEAAAGLEALLAGVRSTGRADDIELQPLGGAAMRASGFLFRQGNAQSMLLRLTGGAAAPGLTDTKAKLLQLVERVPDGFVVTTTNGKILATNEAFLEMAQLHGQAQAQGQQLDRWIGRPGVDLGVLLTNLRQHGSVRLFVSSLRDEFGTETPVEISAGAGPDGSEPTYGFAIRAIAQRAVAPAGEPRSFPKSLEQIIELIGRVSLKDLVREATDVIERLSIEAALTMTGNNRASAAEMLGVSRQSLYVKMRRHGLIEAETVGIE
jgi:transcriptional regulator PpsR